MKKSPSVLILKPNNLFISYFASIYMQNIIHQYPQVIYFQNIISKKTIQLHHQTNKIKKRHSAESRFFDFISVKNI